MSVSSAAKISADTNELIEKSIIKSLADITGDTESFEGIKNALFCKSSTIQWLTIKAIADRIPIGIDYRDVFIRNNFK